MKKVFRTLTIFVVAFSFFTGKVTAQTNPGEVKFTKTAKVVTGDGEDGSSALINLNVNGNSFNIYSSEKEVVLVLDASGSMSESNKLSNLKSSANKLAEELLKPSNKQKIKVGVVYYADGISKKCDLNTNLEQVKDCINSVEADGGTNIQLGIKTANGMFSGNTKDKSLIILSDGEPTFYTDENGNRHGAGNSDNHEDGKIDIKGYWEDGHYYNNYYDKYDKTLLYRCTGFTCTENVGKKPSEAALEEIANFDGKVYTIGFMVNEKAKNFLTNLTGNKGKYYSANNTSDLNSIFTLISEQIDKIATNVQVVDVVPKTFNVNEQYLIDNYGDKTILDGNTYKYGDNLIVSKNDNEETVITWLIGDLKANNNSSLTFRIDAKEDYYGSMFTNDGAILTGKAVDGNPFYSESNPLNIKLDDPTVVIPAVTEDDNYTVNRNQTLTTDKTTGVRKNDYKSEKKDEAKSLTDEVILVNNVKNGTLTLNSDGSFTYIPKKNFIGTDSFTYYILTTVINNNNEKIVVKSKAATVTIEVKGVNTTYVVQYLEKETNKELSNSKTGSGLVGDEITESYINIPNYKLNGEETIKLVLDEENNIITFYYEKIKSSVNVKYLVEGTDIELETETIINGFVGEEYTTSPKNIENWELVSEPTNKNGILKEENESVIYYYKKVIGKLIIKYVDEEGNNLIDSDITEEQTGTEYITKAKDITDYVLIKVEGKENGKYTKEDTIITYVYKFEGGKGQGEPDPEIPNTGINGGYGIEILSILSLISLIVLKKKSY